MYDSLSSEARLKLIQCLNGLPQTQFEELVFALNVALGVLPGKEAAHGLRTKALMEWVEGPTGSGLRALLDLLSKYVDLETTLSGAIPTDTHWLVPYPRNPFFTGREDLLQQMYDTLICHQRAALTQHKRAALKGLGGIGKTQTAVEYVYRYQSKYKHIFWVRAEQTEELLASYSNIAQALQLPGYDPTDRPAVVGLVKRWLEANERWLLVIDNADDLRAVRQYLPLRGAGHLLLTTRAQALGEIAQPLEVAKMGVDEGALFLLRRSKVLSEDADLSAASEADVGVARAIVAEMDGLPLALDQAGAYIEDQILSLEEYREYFQTKKAELLQERGGVSADHDSVTITFKLAFEKVADKNAAAADLLRVCAFLAPDEIPEEIFSAGDGLLGEALSVVAQSKLTLSKIIAKAARFSLISRNPQTKTLTIHRLVQEVLRAEMDEESQKQWASGVVEAIAKVFPSASKHENWPQCDRVAAHAQVAAQLMTDYGLASETAAQLLNNTGYYFNEQGRYEEAEPLYTQALEMNQQLLGKSHPSIALNLNNLAGLYQAQGRYEEAEPLLTQALEMNQQQLGQSHPSIALNLNNLAGLYKDQGRYEEAEPLLTQALEMRQQLLGKSHPQVALSLNNLALLYRDQGRYEEAEPLYTQALEMFQQLLGKSHPQVALSLNNLAGLYKDQGRYEEAEPLCIQALEMSQQLLGQSHPQVALSLNNLAMLYSDQGRYEAAEPLLNQALEMRQQLLGQRHPSVATSLNDLAALYKDQGRYGEAEPLYTQALEMFQQLLGKSHPSIASSLNNLAVLYDAQGRYEEAEPLHLQALAIFEQVLGLEHPHTQTVKRNLQILLKKKESP
ncbi:MAG: tetratricopeptide repeat protein [Leptolyngbya sp. SIO1E4]|nr:tetratricopeptide repeat protein [Leptolyngbya sp. SIO1E4]